MSEQFAKVFDSKDYGQILALVRDGEDGRPELRWFALPRGLGVCEFAMSFEDWDACDLAFHHANAETAEQAAKAIFDAARAATRSQP